MASIKRIKDYASFLGMEVVTDESNDVLSPSAMRDLVENRLEVVERQMQMLARRLDRRTRNTSPWWSGVQEPPDPEFCDSWSGLMYLSHTREQLRRTLKRL